MNLENINKTAELSKNNSMSLMTFKMTDEHNKDFDKHPFYALNIFKIKEVLNTSEYQMKMTAMDEDGFFMGVIAVRGDYISVYDTARWLGYKAPESDDRSVIIVCEVNNKVIGLHVAYIHGVFERDWKEITQSDSMANQSKVVSQTQIDDELCYILDIEEMISQITGTDLHKEAQVEKLEIVPEKIILFADDQASIRQYVKSVFDNLGVNYQIYEDGSGIINYLQNPDNQNKVGLVLTDLEMPNVSGHTVIKEVKENMGLSIPVVVHSSMTVGDSQRQAAELGADTFIGKIDTQEIVRVINHYFA
ncbi:MAG: chemotaxis protein CheV [Methyloprofundus sp.]|nr:chemotaxis protein CheV [Methyloprofundus sp.]